MGRRPCCCGGALGTGLRHLRDVRRSTFSARLRRRNARRAVLYTLYRRLCERKRHGRHQSALEQHHGTRGHVRDALLRAKRVQLCDLTATGRVPVRVAGAVTVAHQAGGANALNSPNAPANVSALCWFALRGLCSFSEFSLNSLLIFIIRSICRGPVYGLAPCIFPTCGTAQKQRGAGAEVAVGELTLARCAARRKFYPLGRNIASYKRNC